MVRGACGGCLLGGLGFAHRGDGVEVDAAEGDLRFVPREGLRDEFPSVSWSGHDPSVQLVVAKREGLDKRPLMRVRWADCGSRLYILNRVGREAQGGDMSVKLNKQAVKHARQLIKAGKVVRDEPGDWRGDQLAAKDETAWLEKHTWPEYASWHFGVDAKATPETKGRYSFPVGDYTKVHRCAVIAVESRAAQNGHKDIAKASKKLLQLIDK